MRCDCISCDVRNFLNFFARDNAILYRLVYTCTCTYYVVTYVYVNVLYVLMQIIKMEIWGRFWGIYRTS